MSPKVSLKTLSSAMDKNNSQNIVSFRGRIDRNAREKLNGHIAKAFWFTGLSGSGKSTLAHLVEEELHRINIHTYTFDGDNVRHGLCGDLSFSPEGRSENLRRIGETVKLFLDAGTVCLTAFISPYEADRLKVRDIIGESDFFVIFIKCPLDICEERDVKGLYKLARLGKIREYTGISAPYEEPLKPDLIVDTSRYNIKECAQSIASFVFKKLNLSDIEIF
jgi:adenylylsulfate kinase